MANARKSRKGVKRKATNDVARRRNKKIMDLLGLMTPSQRRTAVKLVNDYQRLTRR